jgi:hypothetical protein
MPRLDGSFEVTYTDHENRQFAKNYTGEHWKIPALDKNLTEYKGQKYF